MTIDIAKRSPILLLGIGIVLMVVSVLFSVAGFEGAGRRSAELFIVGLLSTVFFAWFIPIYALQRWKTRGVRWQIRIDADGISDSRLGQFVISWGDVVFIRRWTLRGHPYVTFGLRNAEAYRKSLDPFGRRWARLSGALGASSYKLGLYTLNIEESDLISALRAFKPADVVMEGFPETRLSARRA